MCATSPPESAQIQIDARMRARLASYISRRVRNPSDVDDLVQITLLEAWRCSTQFRGDSASSTWVYGVAKNVLRGYFSNRFSIRDEIDGVAVEPLDDSMEVESAETSVEKLVEQRQLLRVIEHLVLDLPKTYRVPLEMSLDGESSYQEIAEELCIPIGTVRSRISRGRGMLVRSLNGTLDGSGRFDVVRSPHEVVDHA